MTNKDKRAVKIVAAILTVGMVLSVVYVLVVMIINS